LLEATDCANKSIVLVSAFPVGQSVARRVFYWVSREFSQAATSAQRQRVMPCVMRIGFGKLGLFLANAHTWDLEQFRWLAKWWSVANPDFEFSIIRFLVYLIEQFGQI
jgi:hypothetical protein